MFIGHYAAAFLLLVLFRHVPTWVPLFGVAFPDLLWGVLVLCRKEEVMVDKNNPLGKSVTFGKFPYSHSLVLGGAISLVVGCLLSAVLGSVMVIPIFVLASSSHWILDTIVHLRDLPVLGFDGDTKVGIGLWRWGAVAFWLELALFLASATLFVKGSAALPVSGVGVVFHAINANSFFGFNKRNPFGTSQMFAIAALVGFGALSLIFSMLL